MNCFPSIEMPSTNVQTTKTKMDQNPDISHVLYIFTISNRISIGLETRSYFSLLSLFSNQMENMFYAFVVLVFLAIEMGSKSATAGVKFDYSGARGPSHWGDLNEEWKACGHGRHQSPIDIVESNVEIYPNLGKLHKSYKAANASLKNRGHDIMVRWAEGAGTIHVDGTNFTLLQCHWHSPAEHTIHGRRYPLEIHMVHQTKDNRTLVIGILYKYGRHDNFLAELTNQISALGHGMEPGAEEALGIIDPKHIKLGSRKYYRYTGSLTTPPCTEGVVWIIVDKVRTVSRDQVRNLIMAVHDGLGKNSRPTQLENGRVVELYTPRHGISKHI